MARIYRYHRWIKNLTEETARDIEKLWTANGFSEGDIGATTLCSVNEEKSEPGKWYVYFWITKEQWNLITSVYHVKKIDNNKRVYNREYELDPSK